MLPGKEFFNAFIESLVDSDLKVLASSKDVIHSWAIPSAGIKIDCVPGYSSHKVMIFLVLIVLQPTFTQQKNFLLFTKSN